MWGSQALPNLTVELSWRRRGTCTQRNEMGSDSEARNGRKQSTLRDKYPCRPRLVVVLQKRIPTHPTVDIHNVSGACTIYIASITESRRTRSFRYLGLL